MEKAARLSKRHWDGAAGAVDRAQTLREESFALIEEDAQAYLAFVEAVRAQHEIDTAHALTIDVPLRMIRAAAEVTELAVQLANQGNPNLRADAVVGAVLAAAAAEAGLLLIEVNLGDPSGDARFAMAKKLARKAGGLALSLRPRDS